MKNTIKYHMSSGSFRFSKIGKHFVLCTQCIRASLVTQLNTNGFILPIFR